MSVNKVVETPEAELDDIEIQPSAQKFKFDRNRIHIFKENLKIHKDFDNVRAALARSDVSQSIIDISIDNLNQELLNTAESPFFQRQLENRVKENA